MMYIFIYFFIFIFGICVGSFLNVLIVRLGSENLDYLPKGQKGISGRSHCPNCGHILRWYDLVPVLSFILLKGKCRYCGKPISWQYPIVELTTGILFFLIFNFQFSIINQLFNFQLSNFITLFYLLFIVSCLIVIFVSDLKYFIIPDKIIIAGSVGAFLYRIFYIYNFFGNNSPQPSFILREGASPLILRGGWGELYLYLLSAIGAGLFFLVIVLVTKGKGMGLGDVKMAFLMGLILGWPKILPVLLLAFVSGALVGLGLIIAGKAKMKSEIPFGVFLSASTFLVMILGENILGHYFGLII